MVPLQATCFGGSNSESDTIYKVTMNGNIPSLIQDRLYLGNMNSANNFGLLRRLRISHILTICPTRPNHEPGLKYLHVSIQDTPSARISQQFTRCIRFIAEALASGGVLLVHCQAGISRSATIIIAYLMKTKQMSYPEAVGCVYKSRPIIKPNIGFVQQLQDFSMSLQRRV